MVSTYLKGLVGFCGIILLVSMNSAYGILKDGSMTCTDNIERELQGYETFRRQLQDQVDLFKEQNGEEKAQEYADAIIEKSKVGQQLGFQKECLQNLGYDIDNLRPVVVPEFHEIAIMTLGGSIAFLVFARKFSKTNILSN